jgi:hypothetical protein
LAKRDNKHELAAQELRWKLRHEEDRLAAEKAKSSCTVM